MKELEHRTSGEASAIRGALTDHLKKLTLDDNNNIEESNKVVQKLMTWSADYNVAIVTVIHTNWGSNKPTGHIGSFLEKKAETQIGLERDGDNGSGTPIIKVSCRQSRNRPFEEHWFTVNKGIPEVLTNEFDD